MRSIWRLPHRWQIPLRRPRPRICSVSAPRRRLARRRHPGHLRPRRACRLRARHLRPLRRRRHPLLLPRFRRGPPLLRLHRRRHRSARCRALRSPILQPPRKCHRARLVRSRRSRLLRRHRQHWPAWPHRRAVCQPAPRAEPPTPVCRTPPHRPQSRRRPAPRRPLSLRSPPPAGLVRHRPFRLPRLRQRPIRQRRL